MAKIKLTDDQREAVYNRGGSLLVSAAAGSGKTKVLVERLFAHIAEQHSNVDDFLIITYTKAAAAELRGKIAQELSQRVAENPSDAHLRRQMFRVYQADIKTVDAFCAGILRENVHMLRGDGQHSLTPDFRVLDESESLLVKQSVLSRVLEAFYEELENGDENASLLAQTLGAGRDDRALEALVLELHSKIQSHPYPLRWLQQVRSSWENPPATLADSDYGRLIMEETVRRAEFWAERLEKGVQAMEACEAVYLAFADRFLEVAQLLRQYSAAANEGWEAMRQIQPQFRRMGTVRGEENELWKQSAKKLLTRCKDDLKKLTEPFVLSEEDYLEDLRCMAPAMLGLIRLTVQFSEAYQKEKLRRNAIDFSDQEHYAIEILLDENGKRSDLARQISARYHEIMVDEYQDTNEVQNCIFSAISQNEQNLFVVGDVKQSIYRFRLADPTIFLAKYLEYLPAAEAKDGESRKVLLSCNFRSRETVLHSTNFIFRNIMSRRMGEMDYGDDEQLNFGATYYQPRQDVDTEFHLISVFDTEDEHFDRTAVEARFVAKQIRKLLDEQYPVQGADGTLRAIREEDIVILMRSPRARQKAFTEALMKEKIACSVSENENLFNTMEIAVVFSLLQIVDNPRQDVPLISVLRSPLFGFSPDRLAQIRALSPNGDYYDALCCDTAEDSVAFCEVLQQLRTLAYDLPVDRLLWELYARLHVEAVFGAMDNGKQRKENLLAFYAYAGQMAAAGKKSVFDFVSHLHRLMGNDKVPVLNTQNSASGIQIMSIHKSKGLEFPVVILADLNKKFNMEDNNRPVLVHPQLGLGTERVDTDRRIRYNTISKSALALQLTRESKAEEMRILYVAMTRAKEKLILVDCMKHAHKHITDLLALTDLPVPSEAVAAANCPGDWILLPLLATYEAEAIHQWAQMWPQERRSCGDGWDIYFWEDPYTEAEADGKREEEKAAAIEGDISHLTQEYPYTTASFTPTKVTATQLKGRESDQEINQGAEMPRVRRVSLELPRFLREKKGLSAAERGTAMHIVMQYLDFAQPVESVKEQIELLHSRRLLSDEQAEAVDVEKLAAFLRSPLAEKLRRAENVLREYPFALLVSAQMYDPTLDAEEQMLLQGVVDCCCEIDGELTVVDFKTDRVRADEVAERAEVYRPQLDAYAAALSQVLEKEVKHKILYFFEQNCEISLK
ncbi:MAG: helicase-exonuclease AddAB subunit AddA [Oscillospiraceae bacterium]|nr:helicase-exonuclease AddAB subunit AddA [Oscillospiraceae bacterium]